MSSIKEGVLSKGKPLEESSSAFAGTIKVGSKETDRVILFEKGPLDGLTKIEFGAMGRPASIRQSKDPTLTLTRFMV